MTIKVSCQCGKKFAAPPHLAGKSVPCPSCGSPILIAAPPAASPPSVPRATSTVDGNVVSCRCGQQFRAPNHLAGRQVSCPVCQQPILIPAAGGLGLDVSLPDPPAANDDLWKDMPQQPAWPLQQPAWAPQPYSPPPDVQASHHASLAHQYIANAYSHEAEQKKDTSNWGTNQIFSGIVMMAIASIWFCTGLMFGIIFFLPPILFISGAIALINGIAQKINR